MTETFAQTFTIFDAIAALIIGLSALMSFVRGFLRELATLGAFLVAIAAAYYAHDMFATGLAAWTTPALSIWMSTLLLVGTSFILVYILVAWLGHTMTRKIHGPEGVSFLDRLFGLFFGAARGFIAMIFIVLMVQNTMPDDELPPWVSNAISYPVFNYAIEMISDNLPALSSALEDRSDGPDAAPAAPYSEKDE